MLALILSTIVALASEPLRASEVSVEVAPLTLGELVQRSDVIVVGHVDKVDERRTGWFSGKHRIADVGVKRVVKGPRDLCQLSYFAEGTWLCDITDAVPGEDALFFLNDAHQSLDSSELFRVAHSGRGRMPMRTIDQRELATLWSGDVELPSNVSTVDGPDRTYDFIRSAPLDELVRSIEIYLAIQAKVRLVASADPKDGAHGSTLVLADDGAGRLVCAPRVDPRDYSIGLAVERVFRAPAEQWEVLRRALDEIENNALPDSIGVQARFDPERSIRSITPKSDRTTRIATIDDAWMNDPARAASARRALRMWSAIRALVDDTTLVDRRKDDARWLESTK